MFSVRVWKLLRKPIHHPLYIYFYNAVVTQKSVGAIVSDIINSNVIFELIALLIAVSVCFLSWLLAFAIIALTPIIVPAIGTYHGLNNALKIGNTLTREQRTGRYDLLAISPLGGEGTHWFIASAVSMSNSALRQTVDVSRAVFVFMAFGLGILVFMRPLLSRDDSLLNALTDSMLTALPFILLSIIVFWDFIQSNIIGSLLGMLIPTYSKQEIEAGALILGAFLFLQVLFYAIVAIMLFVEFSLISEQFDFRITMIILSGSLLSALALRELALNRAWHRLNQRLGIDIFSVYSEYDQSK